MRLTRFEWGCVAVLIAAAILRVTFILQPNFIWDSAWFLMLARSFGESGTFYIRWSDPANPEYSGYWPPLFPIFLSPLVKAFGPSYRTLVLGSSLASVLLVAAVFFATRDLFDRPKAFAAAAIIAASPAFYITDAKGMSESLLGLMVSLTVWAFVKSLDRPIWLPVAGVFAFLAYLGKASLGLPFVAAGVLALAAWRIYRRGWRATLRSPVDIGVAVAGALGIALVAFTRTERIGGLGLGLIEPLQRGVTGADCGFLVGQVLGIEQTFSATGVHCWALAFPLKILFVSAFLFVVTLPLSLRLPQLWRERRTERTDALWLAVILPIIAGSVFTTTFFFTEKRPFVDFDNIRYLTPAIVPFVWLMLGVWNFDAEPDAKDPQVRDRHLRGYWGGVAALIVVYLLNPLVVTDPTLGRFFALVLLMLIPIGISFYARATQYGIRERHVQGELERRYVRERQKGEGRAMIGIAATILVFGGIFYSAWYALVGFGLIVAFATPSAWRRLVAMALVLLLAAAPVINTVVPVGPVVEATSKFPTGTLMGISEIAVFPAAVLPDNVELRLVDPDDPIPDHIDALLMQFDGAKREYANFTRVQTWNYEYRVWPSVQLRVWIEETFLGETFVRESRPGFALFVRDGSLVN